MTTAFSSVRLIRSRTRVRIVRSPRSEEHTSELQSQSNLVCRLLLEKKKNIKRKFPYPLNESYISLSIKHTYRYVLSASTACHIPWRFAYLTATRSQHHSLLMMLSQT